MLVLNLPFKALMFLTLMRPSLVLFLVLWLKLVKDFLKVRCRLALLPFLISCLIWLDLVASLPLIKERILVIILLLHFRKCSSKIITSILSFISGRLATKSNQIKQLIRNGRSASLQRTFKKSFTSFSHSTRNKTRDGLIRVRNIRALNGRFNTSITHAYSIVIGSKHITLNATGGGFLTASKQFRHGATSKSRSNTASNSTKHKSPHLSGWRQIISLIT